VEHVQALQGRACDLEAGALPLPLLGSTWCCCPAAMQDTCVNGNELLSFQTCDYRIAESPIVHHGEVKVLLCPACNSDAVPQHSVLVQFVLKLDPLIGTIHSEI
jgi:hypothetical protein